MPSACRARSPGLTMALEKYGSGQIQAGRADGAGDRARPQRLQGRRRVRGHRARRRSRGWRAGRRPRSCSCKPDGSLIARGTLLVQADLAATLEQIAKQGPRAFYEGPIADKISAAVRAAGGLMTADDLKNYKAVERPVLRGTYRGYRHRIDAAAVVRRRGADRDAQRAGRLRAQAPTIRTRCICWSRPCATPMPTARICSAIRISSRRRSRACCRSDTPRRCARASTASAPRRRTRSRPPIRPAFEGNNTTHYSVVDRFGNAVANTYTLNLSYGVGLIAEGTGVLLNNELDDFAAAPGAPNAFGLVGYEANEPGPNKRPLSSMTPTIVLQERQAVARHRLARRQPHHHRGAAGAAQRHRPPHDASPRRCRRRASIINGCRTKRWSRPACRPRW